MLYTGKNNNDLKIDIFIATLYSYIKEYGYRKVGSRYIS